MDARRRIKPRTKIWRASYNSSNCVDVDSPDGDAHSRARNLVKRNGGQKPDAEAGRAPSPMLLTSVTNSDGEGGNRRVVTRTPVVKDLREKVNKIGSSRIAENQSASSAANGVEEITEGKRDLRDWIQGARRAEEISNGAEDDSRDARFRNARAARGGGGAFGGCKEKLARMGLPICLDKGKANETRSPIVEDEGDPRSKIKTTSPENFIKIEEPLLKEAEPRRRKVETDGRYSVAAIQVLARSGFLAKKSADDGEAPASAGRRIRRGWIASASGESQTARDNDVVGNRGEEITDSLEREAALDHGASSTGRNKAESPTRRVTADETPRRSFVVTEAEKLQQQPLRRVSIQREVRTTEVTSPAAPLGDEQEGDDVAFSTDIKAKREKKKGKGKIKRKLENDDEADVEVEETRKARVIDSDNLPFETKDQSPNDDDDDDDDGGAVASISKGDPIVKVAQPNRAVIIVESKMPCVANEAPSSHPSGTDARASTKDSRRVRRDVTPVAKAGKGKDCVPGVTCENYSEADVVEKRLQLREEVALREEVQLAKVESRNQTRKIVTPPEIECKAKGTQNLAAPPEMESKKKKTRKSIAAPETEPAPNASKLPTSQKQEKTKPNVSVEADAKTKRKVESRQDESGRKSNSTPREVVVSKIGLEDESRQAARKACTSARPPVDAEVASRADRKASANAQPSINREDARKVLNRKSRTPRDDDDVRRSSRRSSSSSSSADDRRGGSNSRRRSPCRRSSSSERRTPSSTKRRRSDSSSSESSVPRQRRRSSPRRSPSPRRRSSSSRRLRRRSSSSRRHRRRDRSASSSSSPPRRHRVAARSEDPRSSGDFASKPVGIATPFPHRPSSDGPSPPTLVEPPPPQPLLRGPPLPPPGLFTHQRTSIGQFSPMAAFQSPPPARNDASFDNSFLSRSLFSTPPPCSVAAAREELRRSSYSVNHPFTRLMASGGLERGVSVPVIDSHCHLDFLFDKIGFRGNLERFCEENSQFASPNFGGLVANFCDPKNSNDLSYRKWNSLVTLPSGHPVKVWKSWSCHPTKAHFFNDGIANFLKSVVNDPTVVAVGETGLDYSRLPAANSELVVDQQRTALAAQCRLAAEARKPLIIHVRDVNGQKTTVHKDTIDILREWVPTDQMIHCHCFTGGLDEYTLWSNNFPNTFFGLTNMVSYQWARDTHTLASQIPLDRLLLETDAPFMTPRCLPAGFGKVCHPGMALCVASSVVELREDGASIADILRETTRNFCRVYKQAPLS